MRLDGNVLNFTSLDITNHLLSASILSRGREEIQVRKAALVGHREGDTRAAFCSGMYCKGVKRHAKYACRIGGEMVLIKLLIGTGLYVGALVSNVYWLVKHIASAGEEVRKRRENGGDYTRYGSYYGYYLRAVVLGTNIGALFCAIVHIIGKL